MEFEGRRRIKMHFDIAPLVDIVFLLLVFFMLTANFIMQPGIKITLPVAKTAQPQAKEKVIVFIGQDNKIFLDDRQISIDELKDVLEERLKSSQDKTVILRADEKIDLGLAVKVMDIAKQAEAEGLIISTKAEEDAKQQSN